MIWGKSVNCFLYYRIADRMSLRHVIISNWYFFLLFLINSFIFEFLTSLWITHNKYLIIYLLIYSIYLIFILILYLKKFHFVINFIWNELIKLDFSYSNTSTNGLCLISDLWVYWCSFIFCFSAFSIELYLFVIYFIYWVIDLSL